MRMNTMHDLEVPAHLKQYVVSQDYSLYTPVNQAVWRYVMQRNVDFLSEVAHPDYVRGLSATGISMDRIPDVSEMNRKLGELGWGAVVVDGLIPSVAFFDFQARGLLPISVDIRTLQHLEYTPAPDIIHEAAGHAPLLYNEEYREYVRIFGEIGSKALGTLQGHEVFEALRNLTVVMENPFSTAEEITMAEQVLTEKRQVRRIDSEESYVSRLYWWTVEYGLMGSVDSPFIYGAGLLSSVAEGKNCFADSVQKVPFDLDRCIHTRYDVTKPQPQLFVSRGFDELIEAVRKLSQSMAFRVGGTESLNKAVLSGRTATIVYSSHLQVTGTFTDVICDRHGEAAYVRTTGPTALSLEGHQIAGHGCDYHSSGFSSPIGNLLYLSKPLEDCSDTELAMFNVEIGRQTELLFASGIAVTGVVRGIHRHLGKLVLISFSDCTVTFEDKVLFKPSWGRYDMAVGNAITSVFAGVADPEHFFQAQTEPSVNHTMSTTLREVSCVELDFLHQRVQTIRQSNSAPDCNEIIELVNLIPTGKPEFWLLRLEFIELLKHKEMYHAVVAGLIEELKQLLLDHPALTELVESGLRLLDIEV